MSRKLTVTLILILFLLPIGSWYYLNSGKKWRQQAQLAMSGTLPVPGLPFMTKKGTRFEQASLEDHVTLLTILDCHNETEQRELISHFYEQFKLTKKANFIFLDTCRLHSNTWFDGFPNFAWTVPCTDSTMQCSALLNTWPAGKTYGLVDRKGVIRSYYSAGTREEKRIMLEHMALLIPREHSEKVELKRGQEK